MKKFLFVTINDHVPWGGSEVLWSETAKHLSEEYKVSALVKKWNPSPRPIMELETKGIEIIYKREFNYKTQSYTLKKIKKHFGLLPKQLHQLDYCNLKASDLVVISLGNHLESKLSYYTKYLKARKIEFVLVLQLVTDLRGFSDKDISPYRESYLNAKKLYFLSKDNIDKAELLFSTIFNNKEFIDNPFNFSSEYLPINNQRHLTLASVAALNSFHKGLDVLLKVLSQSKWKSRNIKINLFGGGHNKDQIERLIDLFDLSEKVHLYGYVDDKKEIWKNNAGLILASRMEGQSLAMLEAMSHGRMVISTNVGDAERLVIDDKTGYLIEASTVNLIDDALDKAWQNRERWVELGKNAREHLFNTITIDPVEDFANKLKELI